MYHLHHISAVLSSLFRLSCYIFLRIIPARLAQPVLPCLYLLSTFTAVLFSFPPPPVLSSEKGGSREHVEDSSSSVLSILIFSLPTSSRLLHISNLLINFLLLCAAADFALTPFIDHASDVTFTRIGAVYPDSVKIAVRYPPSNSSDPHLLRIMYREIPPSSSTGVTDRWRDGPVVTLELQNDWVATAKLQSLWPNTSYEYALSTLNRTFLPYPSVPISFRTFPDARLSPGSHFRFIASSCVIPNFPYMGPFHKRTIRGFDLLASYLAEEKSSSITTSEALMSPGFSPPRTEFLLFLGDFIYADVPIYIGDDREAYRRLYRRNYHSDSFRKIYEQLPIFHAYDDHEFINNFIGKGDDTTPPYKNASSAFKLYNSDANYDPSHPGQHYYEFQYADAAFFVMDTRRHRMEVMDDNLQRTMLGDVQIAALHSWLTRVNDTATFKFVVSSVPFTSLWGHDASIDSWAGFPSERRYLLQLFRSVPNVIIISGDRHEFAMVEFEAPALQDNPILEISTSPMSMFYIPFFRTLKMRSQTSFLKNYTQAVSTDNVTQSMTTSVEVPAERVIKYIPKGNYKWSAIDIDTKNAETPILTLETVVDGKPAFRHRIIGKPVRQTRSMALGTKVSGGVKHILDKFGIKPSSWF